MSKSFVLLGTYSLKSFVLYRANNDILPFYEYRCKESFLYNIHEQFRRSSKKQKFYYIGRVTPKAIIQLADFQSNIPDKDKAIITDHGNYFEVEVGRFWSSYFRLGALALALRIYSGHESFAGSLERELNKFIAGNFTQPKRMSYYYNWRHYFGR